MTQNQYANVICVPALLIDQMDIVFNAVRNAYQVAERNLSCTDALNYSTGSSKSNPSEENHGF